MAVPKLDLDEITYKPGPVDYKIIDQIFKTDYPSYDDIVAEKRKAEVADLQYEKVKRDAAEDEAREALRQRIKETSAGGLGDDDDDTTLRKIRDSAYELGDLDTGIKLDSQIQTRKQQRLGKDIAQYNVLLRQGDLDAAQTWAATKGLDALSTLNVRQRFNPYSGLSVYDPSTGQATELAAPQQRSRGSRMIQMINSRGQVTAVDANDSEAYRQATLQGFHERSKSEGQYDPTTIEGEEEAEGPSIWERGTSALGSLAGKKQEVIPKVQRDAGGDQIRVGPNGKTYQRVAGGWQEVR